MFETFAAAHHIGLWAPTAHHLRQVAMTLVGYARTISGAQRELHNDIGESRSRTPVPRRSSSVTSRGR
jgi:hypothetical protein